MHVIWELYGPSWVCYPNNIAIGSGNFAGLTVVSNIQHATQPIREGSRVETFAAKARNLWSARAESRREMGLLDQPYRVMYSVMIISDIFLYATDDRQTCMNRTRWPQKHVYAPIRVLSRMTSRDGRLMQIPRNSDACGSPRLQLRARLMPGTPHCRYSTYGSPAACFVRCYRSRSHGRRDDEWPAIRPTDRGRPGKTVELERLLGARTTCAHLCIWNFPIYVSYIRCVYIHCNLCIVLG